MADSVYTVVINPEETTPIPGPPGPPGSGANITSVTAQTLAPGSQATVSLFGQAPNIGINFGIPTGNPGNPGPPGSGANITSVTVAGLPSGSQPTGSVSGSPPNFAFNFGIPAGSPGPPGPPGSGANITSVAATTLPPGSQATVHLTGTSPNIGLTFGIPSGAPGSGANITSVIVQSLPSGSQPTGSVSGSPPNFAFNFGIPASPPGPPGPPGSGVQTIAKFVAMGDSYSDNGNSAFLNSGWNFQTSGESFVSNGPTWFSLLSKTYGFAAVPRWNTGSAVGNNYCVAGADIDSGPIYGGTAYDFIFQISTYLSDVSNVVPSNTLIAIWMGVNVCRNAFGAYKGAHDATDPLGTMPAFTMPAASANTSSLNFTEANLAVGDLLWIPVAGFMSVFSYSPGALVLTNSNFTGNATGGTSIPSASARWGAFQYLDNEMTKFVTQINLLVSAGAAKILALNTPNIGANAGTGTSTTIAAQYLNITNYWNSKLASSMASISSVQVYDVASLFASMVSNPPSYGLTVVDIGETIETSTAAGWNQDTYMWYDSLHPSAASHRILYNKLIPVINLFLGVASQQLALAAQTGGVSEPNSVLPAPSWFVPSGNTLAPGVNPFPSVIASTDVRLDYLSRTFALPNLKTEILEDYQESATYPLQAIPGARYLYTYTKVGTANQGFLANPYASNGNGSRWQNVVAANDVAGDLATGVPFLGPNNGSAEIGPLVLCYRAANVLASGDTILCQLGLMDSITSLANGVYFELQNAAGTITANFVVLVSGTRHAFSLGTVAWPSSGNHVTFFAYSDSKWTRYYVYIAGVFVLAVPTLSSGSPAAIMYSGNAITKTVNAASSNSSLYVDLMYALHLSSRRM